MKLNDKPCRTCDRKGCGAYHDICKPYQDAIAADKAEQEEKAKEREINSQIIDHRTKTIRKILHGKRC